MQAQSLYIVATGQHVGKTTVALGLLRAILERGIKAHFFKPVGQQTVEKNGLQIDKDAVLIQSALTSTDVLSDMSPITVPKGFVESYIFNRNADLLRQKIRDAYEKLCHGCELMIVEGTGHAGVGSCLDLSNAEVASLLGAKALLIVEGGMGSTLDEVALNFALFQAKKVDVVGVIANKVWPEKRARIETVLRQGLLNMGLKLLGVIPYDPTLTYPQVGQIARELEAQVLCGERYLDTHIQNVLVAAMEPQDVLPRIKAQSLMITPGDRVDNILLAINSGLLRSGQKEAVVALLLTGGFSPHPNILPLVELSGIPVLLCKEDTYPVTAHVQRMVFKIQPNETEKIEHAQRLVQLYVDVEEAILPYLNPECGTS